MGRPITLSSKFRFSLCFGFSEEITIFGCVEIFVHNFRGHF